MSKSVIQGKQLLKKHFPGTDLLFRYSILAKFCVSIINSSYIFSIKVSVKRIPAMGAKVQIGHFFNGHKNEILFAYPRMFEDTDSKKTNFASKHEVSVKKIF